eukprot:14279-Heterococcus_DN1.PRE.3
MTSKHCSAANASTHQHRETMHKAAVPLSGISMYKLCRSDQIRLDHAVAHTAAEASDYYSYTLQCNV